MPHTASSSRTGDIADTGYPATDLLLTFGLRQFPGLVDNRGHAVPESALKDRMRAVLTDLRNAGYEIGRIEPGADFEDFWEDALRISSTVTAAERAGLAWTRCDRGHHWQPEELARRLGPVLMLEEHHHRDRLAAHPLMCDPAVTGRRIHTTTYHDEHTLADLASDQINYITSPDELASTDPRYADDLITRLRWMFWQGHQAAVIKVDGHKIGLIKITLSDDPAVLREQLMCDEAGLGWTLVRLEGTPGMFRVSEHILMEYEYRLFVVDGAVITGAGCIEEFTPLDHNLAHGALDPQMRKRRGNDIAAPYGSDSEPVAQPGRAQWYAHWVRGLIQSHCSGQGTFVIDVATSGDREDPVLVELNALPNSGLYACDIQALADALVTARDRGYQLR